MAFKAIVVVVALALFLPFAYERGQVASLFWKNAPHRLVKVNTFTSHEIRFSDRIRSCEDALLVESEGVAILGCDPGRERWNTVMGIFLPDPVENGKLYSFNYAKTGLSDDEALKELTFINFPSQSNFHSLGMAYDEPTSTLLVTNHRPHAPPAIEMFRLDLAAHTATHLRSVQHPLLHAPNAVALVSRSEFFVTNDHHFLVRAHPVLSRLETNLGLPGGSVVHVDVAADPPRASVVARLAFANGIALLNATTAAVSSSSKARVHLFSIGRGAGELDPPRFARAADFRVPFSPDNLALARNGALLVAGHPHPPSLIKFAASRHVCNDPGALEAADEEMRETCKTLVAPSWAARWTEEGGLETLYAGVEYPTSATAAWDSDRGVGVLSGLYAKGVFVWRD